MGSFLHVRFSVVVLDIDNFKRQVVDDLPLCLLLLVRATGLEPATKSLVGKCSIHLSYARPTSFNTSILALKASKCQLYVCFISCTFANSIVL